MGIKSLFRGIKEHFPLANRVFNDRPNYKCDNLFIDATTFLVQGLLHNNVTDGDKNINEDMIKDTLFLFDSLIHLLQPTGMIFIATEGANPNAKRWRGRQRRCERSQSKLPPRKDIDNICLQYKQVLIDFFRKKAEEDEIWARPKIIFAGVDVPGEAEQKFVSYIRKMRETKEWNPNQRNCIFTGDSDLILLALQMHEPYTTVCFQNFIWTRNPFFNNQHNHYHEITPKTLGMIDIGILRELILKELGVTEEPEKAIDDFVAITTLLGSDFCPNPKLSVIGIKSIIKSYKNLKDKEHIVENGEYNMAVFKDLIIELLKIVAEEMKMTYEEFVEQEAKEFAQRNLSPEKEVELSHAMLDAFSWTLACYTKGIVSWSWSYPTYFAPPLSVVIQHIDGYKPSFKRDDPPTYLFEMFNSLSEDDSFLPEILRKARRENPVMINNWVDPTKAELDELNDPRNALYKIKSLDYDAVLKVYNELVPEVPEEYKSLTFVHKPFDIRTGEEIDIYTESLFHPVNLSTEDPEETPSFSTIKCSFGIQDDLLVVTPEVEDRADKDIKGKVFYVNWPYKVPAVVLSEPKEAELTPIYGIKLPERVKLCEVCCLDNEHLPYGEKFLYPVCLLVPIPGSSPYKISKETFEFSDNYNHDKINDYGNWVSVNYVAHNLKNKVTTVINALSRVNFRGQSYSLQIMSKDKHVIPGFSKYEGLDDHGYPKYLISKTIIPYIEEYIMKAPQVLERPFLKEEPSDELLDVIAPIIMEVSYLTPQASSHKTVSFSDTGMKILEGKRLSTQRKVNKLRYGFKNIEEIEVFSRGKQFKLGSHVVITSTRTPAPRGTIGTVVANDNKWNELWIICHNFDSGMSMDKMFKSRCALLVDYSDVSVI